MRTHLRKELVGQQAELERVVAAFWDLPEPGVMF